MDECMIVNGRSMRRNSGVDVRRDESGEVGSESWYCILSEYWAVP